MRAADLLYDARQAVLFRLENDLHRRCHRRLERPRIFPRLPVAGGPLVAAAISSRGRATAITSISAGARVTSIAVKWPRAARAGTARMRPGVPVVAAFVIGVLPRGRRLLLAHPVGHQAQFVEIDGRKISFVHSGAAAQKAGREKAAVAHETLEMRKIANALHHPTGVSTAQGKAGKRPASARAPNLLVAKR